MKKRILDKIEEIETLSQELASICPKNFEDYILDIKSKAACERYLERIIEAFVDLSFLVIRHKVLSCPEDDKKSFDILAQADIISLNLAERLKDANILKLAVSLRSYAPQSACNCSRPC